MANKKINNNGFEYVDLGLPSGTLWATCNVGADKPADYGLYFQWGDTKGYTKDQVGESEGQKKFALDWSDYKFGASPNFTKYNAYSATLELVDDAVHANMGGDWHIPTAEQIEELRENTISQWMVLDSASGLAFTSKKDKTKFIFIPAAGCAWNGVVYGIWNDGSIWSSMQSENRINCSHSLDFYNGGQHVYGRSNRFLGLTVRGVIG